jgi:D-arabinose 1-dehydrogenase-like Zn-dependent alcohol dehydrogenase
MTVAEGLNGKVVRGQQRTQPRWIAHRRHCGNPLIEYCTARNIKADIELVGPDQISEAMNRVINNQARYRFIIEMTTGR